MLTYPKAPEDTTGVISLTPARSIPFPGPANPGRRPHTPIIQRGPASTGTKISAVIITYNEGRNIRRTLSKLGWCDEIVIVDSYSTDDTVGICREFGANVFFQAFEGYGTQKKFAVSQAKNDWILCIDADEVLSDDLCKEIQETLKTSPLFCGFHIPMNLVFLGREFRHGKESRRFFPRLFNRQAGGFNQSLVHEKLELKGEISRLSGNMLHYSYANLRQWNEKCDRYSSLSAREALKKGKNKSIFAVLGSLPYYFFRYYILERNFLNGQEGFYWSVLNAYYHFLKYLKIRELHNSAKADVSILSISHK